MRRIALAFALLLGMPLVWAVPDQTMSVSPSATSGTTITAADENSRNNSISTPYNAHTHTDISRTANTLNLGDGTAGNKTLTADAADATDLSIRWNDTTNVFEVQQQVTTYNTVASYSGDPATGGIMLGNGVGGMTAKAPSGDDQLFVSDSGSAETWRTLTSCSTTSSAMTYNTATNSFGCNAVVATATALAANGANCAAGNYPLGVDASGAAESCTAAPSSGLTWVGGTSTEGTTTSTTTADIVTISGLNIPAANHFVVVANLRKSAGAAASASVGIKITQSGGTTAIRTNFVWSTATNQAESGYLIADFGASLGTTTIGSCIVTVGTIGPTDLATQKACDTGIFNNQAVTAVIITGLVGNASVTMGVDEIHVYQRSTS